MSQLSVEGVQGLHILKLYNSDQKFHDVMNDEAEEFRVMTMRVLRMQLQSITIMDLVAYGGTAAGIVLSVVSFMSGDISFFGFICFALLSIEFFVPLRLLGSYFHVGLNGVSAVQLLSTVLEAEVELKEQKNVASIKGDLHLNEKHILKSLKMHGDDKLIVIISHNDSVLSLADEVYAIEGGKVSAA